MPSSDIAPKSTAFVLIDLQNGIAGMPRAAHLFLTVLENTNKLTEALRDEGAIVVLVRIPNTYAALAALQS